MRRNGFSMIELLIVLSIIGIVAAIAAPRFASASSSYRVRTAAQRLGEDIQTTAELARTTATTHGFLIGALPDGYAIDSFEGGIISRHNAVSLSDSPYNCELWIARATAVRGVVFSGYGQAGEQTTLAVVSGDTAVLVSISPETAHPVVGEPIGWTDSHRLSWYMRVGGGGEFDPADLDIYSIDVFDFRPGVQPIGP